jgi:hypothetical protein
MTRKGGAGMTKEEHLNNTLGRLKPSCPDLSFCLETTREGQGFCPGLGGYKRKWKKD